MRVVFDLLKIFVIGEFRNSQLGWLFSYLVGVGLAFLIFLGALNLAFKEDMRAIDKPAKPWPYTSLVYSVAVFMAIFSWICVVVAVIVSLMTFGRITLAWRYPPKTEGQ